MIRAARQSGFTMIELMLVILIVGLLASLAIPRMIAQRDAANDTKAQATVRNAQQAASQYGLSRNGNYLGLNTAALNSADPSISATAPAGSDTAATAPDRVFVRGTSGAGSSASADSAVLCAPSKSGRIACARTDGGGWAYSQTAARTSAFDAAADGVFFPAGYGKDAAPSLPFVQTFSGSGLGPDMFLFGPVGVAGGTAQMTCSTEYAGAGIGKVDMSGRSAEIELTGRETPARADIEMYVSLSVYNTTNDAYWWSYVNGIIVPLRRVGGSSQNGASVPYSAATRYVRVRHTGSAVAYEYSADRSSWTTALTVPTSSSFAAAGADFGCGALGGAAPFPVATMDNFRAY